jgi:hypothetical protein
MIAVMRIVIYLSDLSGQPVKTTVGEARDR